MDIRRWALALVLFSSSSMSMRADPPQWQGTWAATVASGGTFAGTWNAAPGQAPDTVAGAWSLRDQNGAELATGTWAAGKEGKVWKGSWQARRASGETYDGTWQAQSELPLNSRLPALFESAIAKAISGAWRMGNYAGAWTIRAYAQK
jgi:hypothetical protein